MAIATLLVTGAGAAAWPDPEPVTARPASFGEVTLDDGMRSIRAQVSRSAERVAIRRDPAEDRAGDKRGDKRGEQRTAPQKPVKPEIVDTSFLTTALNVWTGPGEGYTFITVLPTGSEVPVSGEVEGDWAEIVRDGKSRWVRAAYLADDRPEPEPEPEVDEEEPETEEPEPDSGGLSDAACASGSAVEDGLTSNAIAVHRAVCADFPAVDSYGGYRADGGEHGSGQALDIMVSDSSVGDEIAEWVRSNSQALGVSEVLWSQQIWTVQRSSEGWRWLEDRGSATANHYDHVHVTVY